MIARKEKRGDERFASNAAIIFSYFSTKNWAENQSVTVNLSASGMCFESRQSLKPGASLYIRTEQNPEAVFMNCNLNLLRISTLGEIRWCQETTHEEGTYYRIGIRYY